MVYHFILVLVLVHSHFQLFKLYISQLCKLLKIRSGYNKHWVRQKVAAHWKHLQGALEVLNVGAEVLGQHYHVMRSACLLLIKVYGNKTWKTWIAFVSVISIGFSIWNP